MLSIVRRLLLISDNQESFANLLSMKFIITNLLLLLSTPVLFAQLNEADTTNWQYRLTATGIILGGNVNDFISSSRAELAHNGAQWGVFSGTSYTYKNRDHEVTTNDITSRNILYYGQRKRAYPFLLGAVSKSLRRGIDFQYQVGPGVAYRLLNDRHNFMRIGSGITYESTRYVGNEFINYESTSTIINKWRLLTFVSGTQLIGKNGMRLVYELNWQPSLNTNNTRLYALAGAEVPLSRFVALRGNIEYIYENVVLVERSKYDFLLTFGITITNIFRTKSEEIEED